MPLIGAGAVSPALAVLAGFALIGVLFALLGVASLLWLALFAFAAEFVTRQAVHGFPAAVTVGYAAALLVCCELASSAASLSRAARIEGAVAVRRLLGLALTIAVAAAAAVLALLGGSVRLGEALPAACIGVAAAAGVFATVNAICRS